MRRFAATLAWATATAIVAASCAGPPATRYYELRLSPERGAAAPEGASGFATGVRIFQVDPPYDQDRIVYRVGERSPEIGFYNYHRWAAPLSRMLPLAVADGLRGTIGLKSIEPVAPGRVYEAYVEGRVTALEEIDLTEGQQVRVRMRLVLRLEDGTELWSGTVGAESTAPLRDVRQVVARMSVALGEAVAEARSGMEAALRQH